MQDLIIFDTETTSLFEGRRGKPGGEVIQFAAIIVDNNFHIKRIINRYCSSTQLIDPGAEKVHKLSERKLSILSNNKFFETIVEEEGLRNFNNHTWVGHNVGFDIRMTNQTLTQNGYPSIDFGRSTNSIDFNAQGIFKYDTMSALKSIDKSFYNVKLSQLVANHIGYDKFKRICKYFRDKYNIIDPEIDGDDYFHNAFFDALGLSLLINKYKNLLLK